MKTTTEISPTIIDAVERIRLTPDASLTVDAISFLHERGVLTQSDHDFLTHIYERRRLSKSENNRRIEINMTVLEKLGLVPFALETIMGVT